MRITTVARYRAWPGERKTVVELLRPAMIATAAEEGCVYFHALAPDGDPDTIILIEGWRGQADLEAHRLTPHYRDVILGLVIPALAGREVVTSASLFEGAGAPDLS